MKEYDALTELDAELTPLQAEAAALAWQVESKPAQDWAEMQPGQIPPGHIANMMDIEKQTGRCFHNATSSPY